MGLIFICKSLVAGLLLTLASGVATAQFGGGGGGPGGGGGSNQAEYRPSTGELSPADAGPKSFQYDEAFGLNYDPEGGNISFSITDVSIPGNFPLQVAATRSRSQGLARRIDSPIGDWAFEVPRLEAYDASFGTIRSFDWCDNKFIPNSTVNSPGYDQAAAGSYFNGVRLVVPGHISAVVVDPTNNAKQAFPNNSLYVTPQNWYLTCSNAAQKKLIAHAPNGTKYYLEKVTEWRSTRVYYHRHQNRFAFEAPRRIIHQLRAVKAEDVHGNEVTYSYQSGKQGRLTRISATDGRQIDFAYSGNTTTVTANGRTWQYITSGTHKDRSLDRVVLPDGTDWVYTNLADTMDLELGMVGVDQSGNALPPTNAQRQAICTTDLNQVNLYLYADVQPGLVGTFSVENPQGSTATFRLEQTKHGRTVVPIGFAAGAPPGSVQAGVEYCSFEPSNPFQRNIFRMSLTDLDISGPSLGSLSWDYQYSEQDGAYNLSSNDHEKWTEIAKPDGTAERHYFNRQVGDLDGLLTKRQVKSSTGGGTLEETSYTYTVSDKVGYGVHLLWDAQALPASIGKYRQVATQTTKRSSDTYTTNYQYDLNLTSNGFDYGAPYERMSSSSTTTDTKTELFNYLHKTNIWRLNLLSSKTLNGQTVQSATYDGDGMPLTSSVFGALQYTYSYNGDGTLGWMKDALNRQTQLGQYKRGQPQLITFADGSTNSRTIDDNGWTTNFTDGRGYQTGYTYNSLGWLTSIARPGSFANTTISYSSLGSGTVQTATRGNLRTTTTFDGFNRPISTNQTALTSGGSIHTARSYDAFGRVTFESLPSFSAGPTQGMDITYDALGRVVTQRETMSPYATTSTAYLSGNRVSLTDPEGGVTTSTYRAFGKPATEELMQVSDPTGTITSLNRNIYGNITSLNQSSALNGYSVNVTRNFWYDSRQRLCRHYAPEFGHELFTYNNANELVSQSRGDTAGSSCATPAANIATKYQYDAMGRQKKIDFPSGTPDIFKTYDANGNALTINRSNRNWTYTYDELNNLRWETLDFDGQSFNFQHFYNSSGHIYARRYPGGMFFWLDPDDFGRPQELRRGNQRHADNITYHPNGMVASATYQNGTSYSQSLNARQLVSAMSVNRSGQAITNATYSHNKRGQITSLNGLAAGGNISYEYDAKGRLIEADGSFGLAEYTYDGLDNLRLKEFPNRTVTLGYDSATNRLSSAFDTREGSARTISHDTRGNIFQNGAISLWHDWSNQPVYITGPSDNTGHVYDGNLKRIKTYETGKQTYWIYSALSGTPIYSENITTGEVTHYFDTAGMRLQVKDNVMTWTHLDHQGSAVAATDASGATLWTERYLPFGEKLIDPSANQDRPGYTGHVQDSWSGLTYMQARYYDPVLGRFMSTDPIGYQDQLNLYAYVGNDPVNVTDPTGLCRGGKDESECEFDVDVEESNEKEANDTKVQADKILQEIDRQISNLDDDTTYVIDGGLLKGEYTGADLKKHWNDQRFTLTDKNFGPVNGGVGSAAYGSVTMNYRGLNGWMASPGGGAFIILHDGFGHLLPMGQTALRNSVTAHRSKYVPGTFYQTSKGSFLSQFAAGNEAYANTAARSLGGILGYEPFYDSQGNPPRYGYVD